MFAGRRNLNEKILFSVPVESSAASIELAPAVENARIEVVSFILTLDAVGDVQFQSFDGDATFTTLTGPLRGAADGAQFAMSYNPDAYFKTLTGEALVLENSSEVAVGGLVQYWLA